MSQRPRTSPIEADGVLVVVCEGTSLKKLDEARDRIALTGKPIIGYVYNRATDGTSPATPTATATAPTSRRRRRLP